MNKYLIIILLAIVAIVSLHLVIPKMMEKPFRELTVYTTEGIYYININELSVTEENQDIDEPIAKFSKFEDLEDWVSNQTARDANISALIPKESFVYGGSYWDDIMPVVIIKPCFSSWEERLDTIGYIIPETDYSQIQYKPL